MQDNTSSQIASLLSQDEGGDVDIRKSSRENNWLGQEKGDEVQKCNDKERRFARQPIKGT